MLLKLLPAFISATLLWSSASAQSSASPVIHSLIRHLNHHIQFDKEDVEQKIAGEMLLIITLDSTGQVTQAEIKKGISSRLNDQVLKVCLSFKSPRNANDIQPLNPFALIISVDCYLRKIDSYL